MTLQNIYRLASLLCLLCVMTPISAQSLIDEANEAYQKGDYAEAIELYEQSGETDGTSAAYFYNLGNAYYKSGLYPAAILNYERALRLNPGDEDIHFNLEMAQARISDKIEPLGTFFLTQWVTAVRNLFSSDTWAVMAVVLFLVFLGGIVLYFFVDKVALRKVGFFVGLLAFVFSLAAHYFAGEQKQELIRRDTAIIFAPAITVKSTPSETGTDLFVLHEGTKVTLLDKVGGWSEIRLEDGNRGWIPTDKCEVI